MNTWKPIVLSNRIQFKNCALVYGMKKSSISAEEQKNGAFQQDAELNI